MLGREATTDEKFELARELNDRLRAKFAERGLQSPSDLRQVLRLALEANSPTDSEVCARGPFGAG
ncbi:MAG: hypothetical protein RJQ08_08385 [Salinisphaeraceae bacterium]